ncbi:MAG: hypothetical protein NXI31_24920, partial [bacterium]|nr:hypothetical protein [bacterium]
EHRVDPRRIALLAWSSSGPVAYHLLTAKRSPFSRGYVAMSVWRPQSARALKAAKGRRFVLDQSPEDQVTAFSHVRTAFHALAKAGAIVQLSTYEGGHGWQDGPIPRLRRQLAWLFSNAKAREPEWPAGEEPIAADGNLVRNGGFERGAKRGWRTIDNSGRLMVEVDTEHKREGKQSLHLSKTGAVPLDLVVQDIDLPLASDPKAEEVIEFAVDSRTADCKNAWLKVWLYDSEGKVCNSNQDVNVARFRGTADWQRHQVRMARGSAVRATIQCLLVLGGEIWLDDVVLRVVDRERKKD